MTGISLFEQELVHHCSPAFARLKPANLVCFQKLRFPDFNTAYQKYKAELKKFSIEMEILCSCDKRYLVLVYQRKALEYQLRKPQIANQLAKYGYPTGSLEAKLEHLSKRLYASADFPHEIGLFLGYPLNDVVAFAKNKGLGAKLCGYWKVYYDVEYAKRVFDAFDKCRSVFEKRLFSGATLTQLLEMRFMYTA